MQRKTNESTPQDDYHVPFLRPKLTDAANGNGTSKKACDDEQSTIILSKIKAWLEAKRMSVPQRIQIDILGSRRANVMCFHCNKSVALSTRDNKNGSWGWIVSNFTQHVQEHVSCKKNTLDTYFRRPAYADSPTVQPTAENATNMNTEMRSSPDDNGLMPSSSNVPAPPEASSITLSSDRGSAEPMQKYELILYEDVLENYGDLEFLNNTSSSSGDAGNLEETLSENHPEASPEAYIENSFKREYTPKTVLEIEYAE